VKFLQPEAALAALGLYELRAGRFDRGLCRHNLMGWATTGDTPERVSLLSPGQQSVVGVTVSK
jgi:hypothetical protein